MAVHPCFVEEQWNQPQCRLEEGGLSDSLPLLLERMVELAAMLLGGGGLPDSLPLVLERMAASSWEGMLIDNGDDGEGEASLEDTVAVTTDAFCKANDSEISGETVAHTFACAAALRSFLTLLTSLHM